MNPRRLTTKSLLSAALLLTLCSHVGAQTTAPPTAGAARVERLAGLARVWGAVKYFHPYLAYR